MKDGDGWVGGSLTGWKVGAKTLQDEDGNGRLPDCRERICTAGCCFVSIMQITCECCAVLPWVCCFGRGWLAAPQAAAAAPVTVGSIRPRAQEGKWNCLGQLFWETPQLVHTGVLPLNLLCCFKRAKNLTHQILCWGKCLVLPSLVKLSAKLPVIPYTYSFRSISPELAKSNQHPCCSELSQSWEEPGAEESHSRTHEDPLFAMSIYAQYNPVLTLSVQELSVHSTLCLCAESTNGSWKNLTPSVAMPCSQVKLQNFGPHFVWCRVRVFRV